MDRNLALNRIASAIVDVRDEVGEVEYLSLSVRYKMAERALAYLTDTADITTREITP